MNITWRQRPQIETRMEKLGRKKRRHAGIKSQIFATTDDLNVSITGSYAVRQNYTRDSRLWKHYVRVPMTLSVFIVLVWWSSPFVLFVIKFIGDSKPPILPPPLPYFWKKSTYACNDASSTIAPLYVIPLICRLWRGPRQSLCLWLSPISRKRKASFSPATQDDSSS